MVLKLYTPNLQGFKLGWETFPEAKNVEFALSKRLLLEPPAEPGAELQSLNCLRGFLELRRPWGFSPEER